VQVNANIAEEMIVAIVGNVLEEGAHKLLSIVANFHARVDHRGSASS
jgi:hypothetical protein